MAISRNRRREGDKTRREFNHTAEGHPSDSAAVKPHHWRNRKRKRTKNAVSGVTLDGQSSDTNSTVKSSWTILNTYGGRFHPKTIFSKDEKHFYFKLPMLIIYQVFICRNQKGSQGVEHKKRPVCPFHWEFAREGEHC
jgi:hypothetical protein